MKVLWLSPYQPVKAQRDGLTEWLGPHSLVYERLPRNASATHIENRVSFWNADKVVLVGAHVAVKAELHKRGIIPLSALSVPCQTGEADFFSDESPRKFSGFSVSKVNIEETIVFNALQKTA